MKKFLIVVVLILVAAVAVVSLVFDLFSGPIAPESRATNFDECAAAGYPVMESYPRQCRMPDGRNFVEEIADDKSDLIVVDTPTPGATVKSPIVLKGKARGNWYFEASFPAQLVLGDGTIIAQIPVQARGEWMTTEFVPFETVLTFSFPALCLAYPCSVPATLVLKKDNPSGLPEHDDSISIPIRISEEAVVPVATLCRPTGCSGQICSDEDVVTTCEYKPEYACYKKARCEKQLNGECGWTKTLQFSQCLTEGIILDTNPDHPM